MRLLRVLFVLALLVPLGLFAAGCSGTPATKGDKMDNKMENQGSKMGGKMDDNKGDKMGGKMDDTKGDKMKDK